MASLKRNILTYGIADLIARSISLITSPITTRLLTLGQYGATPLLTAIWTPFSLLQYGGMDSAYPYFKAKDHDEKNRDQLIATSTFISNACMIFMWCSFMLLGLSGEWLQNYAGITRTELVLFMLTLLPAGLIYWLLYILRFMGQAQSFVRITLLGRILPVLITLPVLFVIQQPDRLMTMWGLSVILQLVAFLYALYELRRVNLWPYIVQSFSKGTARKMLGYGAILAPVAMVYALSTITDRLLIGWFMDVSAVAVFQLAVTVGSVSTMLAAWFGLAFDPHLVDWIAQKKIKEYRPRIQLIVNIIIGVFLGLVCGAAIWSDWLFYLLYPSDYSASAHLVPLLVLVSTFPILSRVAIATILIADKPRWMMCVYIAGFFINLAFGVYLIPKIGIIGAAYGTLASEAFTFLIWCLLGKFYYKNLDIKWLRAWIGCALCFVLISFYTPPAAGSLESLLECLTATILLTIAFFVYLRVFLGAQQFKELCFAPLSFVKLR